MFDLHKTKQPKINKSPYFIEAHMLAKAASPGLHKSLTFSLILYIFVTFLERRSQTEQNATINVRAERLHEYQLSTRS